MQSDWRHASFSVNLPDAVSLTMIYNLLNFPAGSVPVSTVTAEDEEKLGSYTGNYHDRFDRLFKEVRCVPAYSLHSVTSVTVCVSPFPFIVRTVWVNSAPCKVWVSAWKTDWRIQKILFVTCHVTRQWNVGVAKNQRDCACGQLEVSQIYKNLKVAAGAKAAIPQSVSRWRQKTIAVTTDGCFLCAGCVRSWGAACGGAVRGSAVAGWTLPALHEGGGESGQTEQEVRPGGHERGREGC